MYISGAMTTGPMLAFGSMPQANKPTKRQFSSARRIRLIISYFLILYFS